jgi:(p)ppGpp synthase/HD superfamily hydrolase
MDYLVPCQYSIRLIEKLKSLDTKNVLDLELINKAIYWAKKYHGEQKRKSGEAYYTHPLEVAYMISDYKLKTDVIVASILHDIIEDTEVTYGMILENFGQRIAEMVDRLTRDRLDGSKLSVEEILNNAYRLKDNDVLLIKLFDRLHNIKTLSIKPLAKIIEESKQTIELFILLSIYLQNSDIENAILQECCKNLSIKAIAPKLVSQDGMSSILNSKENNDTYQLLSQVFENEAPQWYKILKWEQQ